MKALFSVLSIFFGLGIVSAQSDTKILSQPINVLTKPGGWYNIHFPTPIHFKEHNQFEEGMKMLGFDKNLCYAYKAMTDNHDDDDDTTNYEYEAIIFKAAGIVNGDPEKIIGEKLRSFWEKNGDKIGCHDGVHTVSFYKSGLRNFRNHFLGEALYFKLPRFNDVGFEDGGRTLLDAVADEYQKYDYDKVNFYRKDLASIYDRLRAQGAKHRFELEKEKIIPTDKELYKQFIPAYYEAADKGDAWAMFYIAHTYIVGMYVPKDLAKARKWLDKATKEALDKKDYWALGFFGVTYDEKLNDPKTTFSIYKKMADGGDNSGRVRTANFLFSGYGTERNVDEAFKYYMLAKNESTAQAMIGRILVERGQKEEGAKWLRWTSQTGGMQMPIGDGYTVTEFCKKHNIKESEPRIEPKDLGL